MIGVARPRSGRPRSIYTVEQRIKLRPGVGAPRPGADYRGGWPTTAAVRNPMARARRRPTAHKHT